MNVKSKGKIFIAIILLLICLPVMVVAIAAISRSIALTASARDNVLLETNVVLSDGDVSATDMTNETVLAQFSIDNLPGDLLGIGVVFSETGLHPEAAKASEAGTVLPAGETVYILEFSEGFYRIVTPDGAAGWVSIGDIDTGGVPIGADELPETTEETEPTETTQSTTTTAKSTKKGQTTTTTTTAPTTALRPEDFPVNGSPYFVYVEKGSHTITFYAKDEKGKYTRVVRTYLTATGRTSGLTPVGLFNLGGKEEWHRRGNNSYSPFATSYKGGLFFHGPLYTSKSFGALKENSVAAIGSNASSGCMRTSVEAAYFLFRFCPSGTYVKIVNGSPLGRGAGRPSVASQYIDPRTGETPVVGVSLAPQAASLEVGASIGLTVSIQPAVATEKACVWSSSDTGVARVDDNGRVTAVSNGAAVIRCTTVDGGFVAQCTVTVGETTTESTTTETTTTSATTTTTIESTTKETTTTSATTTTTTTTKSTTKETTTTSTTTTTTTKSTAKETTTTSTTTTTTTKSTAKETTTTSATTPTSEETSSQTSESTTSQSEPPESTDNTLTQAD